MVDKGTDHENDDGGAVCISFSGRAFFRKTATSKHQGCCKKANRQQFSVVCTPIVHRNDVKMFKTMP